MLRAPIAQAVQNPDQRTAALRQRVLHLFAMTDAFIKAAEAKGHTVTRFDTSFMNIGFCHDCETCFNRSFL